jgi:hypothetical protein
VVAPAITRPTWVRGTISPFVQTVRWLRCRLSKFGKWVKPWINLSFCRNGIAIGS